MSHSIEDVILEENKFPPIIVQRRFSFDEKAKEDTGAKPPPSTT